MNQVSQCPSHDTGKLAHGDKLASSVICSESLVDDSDVGGPSSGFLRAGGQQNWGWSSVQTGERHRHVTVEQCGELEKCVRPLQPGRTQWGDRTKAAPEVYAGQQRTRGQKQSTWCLEDKATGSS